MTAERPSPKFCVRHRPRSGRTDIIVRPALGDGQLCDRCHAEFKAALSAIADSWPSLRSVTRQKGPGNETGRSGTGGHRDVGDLWNEQAATVTIDIYDFVSYLMRLSTPADRKLPRLAGDQSNVLRDLIILSRYYVRFLAGHEQLGPTLLGDAVALARRAQGAINGTSVRRYPLPNALCAHEVYVDQIFGDKPVYCGGQLYAVIVPDGDSRVVCSNDPRHAVKADDWIHHLEQVAP